jgi:hypothetical protein
MFRVVIYENLSRCCHAIFQKNNTKIRRDCHDVALYRKKHAFFHFFLCHARPFFPFVDDDDDDGDFYSVTLAFRQTTGNKRMGISEMA